MPTSDNTPAPAGRNRFVRRTAVKARFGGISDATLYRMVKAGRLPKPVKIAPQVNVWVEDELEAAADRMVAARDGRAA